jgi:hypothetical protein
VAGETPDIFQLNEQQAVEPPPSEPAPSAAEVLTEAPSIFDLNQQQEGQLETPVDTPDVFALADLNTVEEEKATRIRRESISEIFQPGQEVTAKQATFTTVPAAAEFFADDHGGISKFFYTLTLPEQIMARNAVNALENLNFVSSEEAKDLLSKDQLHGSDIVEFFWETPESFAGKAARFSVGLLTDILIDPLTWMTGFGGVATQLSKRTAQVVGRTKDLNKLQTWERNFYRAGEKVETIVDADGAVRGLDAGADAITKNKQEIARFLDTEIGFDDLAAKLDLTPSARAEVELAGDALFEQKGIFREIVEGDRDFVFGVRVPFTNMAATVPLPFKGFQRHTAQTVEKIMSASEGTFDAIARVPVIGVPFAATKWIFNTLATKTGFEFFDNELNKYYGRRELTRDDQLNDIVEEIELEPLSVEDAFERLTEWAVRNPNIKGLTEEDILKKINNAIKVTDADKARRARIKLSTPGAMELIDDIRQQNAKMVAEYVKRGVPFNKLNPFGEGWARQYLKHKLSDEWIDHFKNMDEALSEAEKFVFVGGKGTDPSALGRKFRGTIREANEETLEKFGVKIFIDDPIDLHVLRMNEMDMIVRNFDLMEAASVHAKKGQFPGHGWVEFKADDFKDLVLIPKENPEHWKQFVPKFFKNTDEKVWLPERIHDRLSKNLKRLDISGEAANIWKGVSMFSRLFRANALYGTGYLGLNMFSNMTTYAMTGAHPKHLMRSMSMLTDVGMFGKGRKRLAQQFMPLKDAAGTKYSISHEQLWDKLIQHNVVRSGITNVKLTDVFDNVASTSRARAQSQWWRPKNLLDVALLYRTQRNVAQWMDDVPKIGVFLDRLDAGYSFAGAAEAAERAYFNYNNISSRMRFVREAFPFATFPVKTVEFAFDELSKGKLAQLAMPQKVLANLEGAYMSDQETREFLNQTLPTYRNFVLDPVFGPLLPGGREVILELPFAKTALDFLWNPARNLHPFLESAIGMAGIGQFQGPEEELEVLSAEEYRRGIGRALDQLLPPPIKTALAIAEINGVFNVGGGIFARNYLPEIPNQAQRVAGSPVAQKFDNAFAFGQFVENELAENFMYKLFFPEEYKDRVSFTEADQQIVAARGQFIRRHFRQMTAGLATMTSLDKNFLFQKTAIDRQIRKANRKITEKQNQLGALFNADKLNDAEFISRMAKNDMDWREVQVLKAKQDALSVFYDWILHARQEAPDLDLGTLLFGMDDYQYDLSGKPAVYKLLNRNKAKDVIFDVQDGFTPETVKDPNPLED